MPKWPTLSIVIPTLGRPTLEDALGSICPQLHQGDEVVVVFDSHGSDAAAGFSLRKRLQPFGSQVVYAEVDAGRHYYGGTAQSNYGFTIARGDYVMSLGDDDAYVAGAFDKIRAALKPGRALITQVFIPHNGLILPGGHYFDRDAINGCSMVAPREALAPFALDGLPSADFDWMQKIVTATDDDPVWLDACAVITFASRRNGTLANAGPTQCATCRRGLLIEDTDAAGNCIVCRTPKPSIERRTAAHALRIAFVWPAAEMSVSDVARGYRNAFDRAGHTLFDFKLHNRFKYHSAALAAAPGGDRSGDMGLLAREATEGIAAFVLRHEPDFVVIVSGMSFHPDGLVYLRKLGVPAVSIFTESPYNDEQQLAYAAAYPDMLCATQDAASARTYGWLHLPPSYDPEVHFRTPRSEEFGCDVFMVGTGWQDRQEVLEGVNWAGIDCRLYGHWPGVAPTSPIFRCVRWTPRGSVLLNNTIVTHAYASAKISLNIHRDWGRPQLWDDPSGIPAAKAAAAVGQSSSANPRVMEIAACGGFLLTDRRPELDRIFPGIRVPTFDPHVPGDLEAKIRYWLAHDAERDAMADRMRQAVEGTVARETFDARVATLFEAMQERRIHIGAAAAVA